MNLKTLKFIYGILEREVRCWRGMRISENYRQHVQARDELKGVIEVAEKQAIGLRQLAYKNKSRLPVRVPFDIEVDII